MSIPILFNQNLLNAKNAIKEKRYELVTIFGNRILSDIIVFKGTIETEEIANLSVIGFSLRKIGTDLYNLSRVRRDTAKLKQKSIETLSKLKETMQADENDKIPKILKLYESYVEAWALEVNENDISVYSRTGEYDQAIFSWGTNYLKTMTKIELINIGEPVTGLANELIRMSYVEHLSAKTHLLSIVTTSLALLIETLKGEINFVDKSPYSTEYLDWIRNQNKETIAKMLSKLVEISSPVDKLEKDKELSKFLKEGSLLLSDILSKWRENLNVYFQLQTGLPATSISEKEESKETISLEEKNEKS